MKLPHFTFFGGREHKTSTFFPELRYKLSLEFNSRKICQHLTNWTRWNKRDKFCLSSLVIRELKQLRRRPQRRLQKNNRFNDQNNSSVRRFMEDVDIRRRIFLPLLNLNKILKNSTPGKVAYIWHIERVQLDAIKFERTQIHFFCRRFHGRRRPCLRPLLTYRGLFPYGNLSITDGLFNSKDANLHIIPPFVLRIMTVSHWCRAPSSLFFAFSLPNLANANGHTPVRCSSVLASLSVELSLD